MDKSKGFYATLTVDVVAALVTALSAFQLITADEAAALNKVAVAVAPIVALIVTAFYNREPIREKLGQ